MKKNAPDCTRKIIQKSKYSNPKWMNIKALSVSVSRLVVNTKLFVYKASCSKV